MTPEELITSGQLELFVYGTLSTKENEEIIQMAKEHTIIQEEITAIEASLYRLSSYSSPYLSARNYERIKAALNIQTRSIGTNYRMHTFIGYAASILFLIGIGIVYQKYNDSTEIYQVITKENNNLNNQLNQLSKDNSLLNEIRETSYTRVTLAGQAISPTSSANIYWDKDSHKVIVDIENLPEPPAGKVYQIWALDFEPSLTPSSIGVLDNYAASNTKLFVVDNVDSAQGFGITLEPEGGSKSPTLEQLYSLGKV